MSHHRSLVVLSVAMSVLALSACDERTIPTGVRQSPGLATVAGVSYSVVDLEIPDAGEGGAATSINGRGQVVGYSRRVDDRQASGGSDGILGRRLRPRSTLPKGASMNTRSLLVTGTLLVAAAGCRDDAESPTESAPVAAPGRRVGAGGPGVLTGQRRRWRSLARPYLWGDHARRGLLLGEQQGRATGHGHEHGAEELQRDRAGLQYSPRRRAGWASLPRGQRGLEPQLRRDGGLHGLLLGRRAQRATR